MFAHEELAGTLVAHINHVELAWLEEGTARFAPASNLAPLTRPRLLIVVNYGQRVLMLRDSLHVSTYLSLLGNFGGGGQLAT